VAEDGRQAPPTLTTPNATHPQTSIFTATIAALSARESPPLAERVLPTAPQGKSHLVSFEDIVDVSLDPLTSNTFESIVVSYLCCPQRT